MFKRRILKEHQGQNRQSNTATTTTTTTTIDFSRTNEPFPDDDLFFDNYELYKRINKENIYPTNNVNNGNINNRRAA